MDAPSLLRRAARAARELRRRRELRPLDYLRWLPLQHAFLTDPSKRKQMRAGNQAQGKTTAGLAEGIYHALGEHPFYAVPPPPTQGAIVCTTWSQSLAIQQKLWELLPKDELDPETEFEPGKGFRGRHPLVRWRNGSLTWILTAQQGGLALAGRTYDWVHFDEPPAASRIYAEMVKRLVRGNPGRAWLTYTPVNAPTDYLKELVEQGQIVDHWSPLTEAAMVPVGDDRPVRLDDGTICDGAWIQSIRADSLPHEVPVVVDGEWEFRIDGNVFRAFRRDGPTAHVTEKLPAGDVKLQLGIDHGSGNDFSSVAILVAIQPHPLHPRVWVLDEYVSTGETTEDEDAQSIVAMLQRWGKGWNELAAAFGDRPWERRQLQRKSNEQLEAAIERHLGVKKGTLTPSIATVKRGKGRGGSKSVHFGAAFLHRSMVRDGCFHVYPTCEHFISALGRWSGQDDQWKHIIDAARYACDPQIFAAAPKLTGAPNWRAY